MVGPFNHRELCVIYFLTWQLNYVLNQDVKGDGGGGGSWRNPGTLIGSPSYTPSTSSPVAQAHFIISKENDVTGATITNLSAKNLSDGGKSSTTTTISPLQTLLFSTPPTLISTDTSEEQGRGCPACADPDCGNPVYKWIWDFRAITKTFIGLAIGTVVFFVLFIAYKFISYTDEIDYYTSTYYGSGNKKPLFRSASLQQSDSVVQMLTRMVTDALETSY